MKKWLLLSGLCTGLSFVGGFFYKYHLPRIESWLLLEVERISTKHLPVRIWPQKVSLSLFPPKLIIYKTRLLPQKGLEKYMALSKVEQAEIKINWLTLFLGQLRLSELSINGINLAVIEKIQPRPLTKRPATFDFSLIEKIPIDRLRINDFNLLAKLESAKLAWRTQNLKLDILNRRSHVYLNVSAPLIEIKTTDNSHILPMSLNLRGQANATGAQVSGLKVKVADSFLVGAGKIDADPKTKIWSDLNVILRTNLDLPSLAQWAHLTGLLQEPVDIAGSIRSDFHVEGATTSPRVRANTKGSSLRIKEFVIGDVQAKTEWQNSAIKVDYLTVQNNSGSATLKNAKWKPADHEIATGELSTDQIELGQLLRNLGLKNIPLQLTVAGKLPCQGPLYPEPSLKCQGQVKAKDLILHTDVSRKKMLLEVPTAQAEGWVTITKSNVSYNANLQVGQKSRGHSDGIIDYQKGFMINYKGAPADLKDIKNLADLKLEGSAEISGKTWGTSHWGRIELQASGKDVWLDDYFLGQPRFNLTYKEGTLYFQQALGLLGASRYAGDLSVNLIKKQIEIKGKAPYLELNDLKEVFKRKINLPVSLAGAGTAEVKASGPLQFNALSYNLRSAFFRGSVANESFDKLNFNLNAKHGQVTSEAINISRGTSVIDLTGHINPEGKIDASLNAKRFRLEESENVTQLGLDVTGQVDGQMSIKGQLPRPSFAIYGKVSKLVLGQRPSGDSSFNIFLNSENINGSGELIGDVLRFKFSYPLVANQPLKLWAQARGWDFANSFSLLSASARQRDFQTSLTALINLQSDTGLAKDLSGEIEVNEAKISRGSLNLENKNTIFVHFNNGTINAKTFNIEGSAGYIKAAIQKINQDHLDASINGRIEMEMLTLIAPFFSELQGIFAFNMNFAGKPADPALTGSAYIEHGTMKFKEFPHPFTNIRADLLFNHQSINVNTWNADLASGQITGDGQIRFLAKQNIPVDIRGQIKNVNLNVPPGYSTRGSGSWSLNGKATPYMLNLNYVVEAGEVTAEFSGDLSKDSRTITPSALLPKFLNKDAEQPIHLNLDLQFKNHIQVRNSMVNSGVKGQLKVKGPFNSLRLTGLLNPLPGGKVYFRDAEFEVNTGFVEYNDDPPENPKIYLSAQSQIIETVRIEDREQNNQYEVNLLVQGRAKTPRFALSSLPPLSEKEIASLLALGMTSTNLENRKVGDVAQKNSLQIGTAILQKPLNKEVRNRLGVDVSISQQSSNVDNTSFTKFTFSKQFTPKLGASASRTVEKNPVNSGKIEYKFNRNFSAIGSYEGKEGTSQLDNEKQVDQSIFGLDLEFKVNFK